MSNIIIYIKEMLNKFSVIKKFCKHNKKNFQEKTKNKNEILIEFNAFQPTHIALSYLSNTIKKNKGAQIKAYFNYSLISSNLRPSLFNKLKWIIGNILSIKNFGIYKSFGVTSIFKPSIDSKIENNSKKMFNEIVPKLSNKSDVLNITLDGMQFGDLIYDTYLKSLKKKTLDINDNLFKKQLLDFLRLYFFWKEYFNNNKVDAIIGVHTVYSYAIPLRMAINKNISTYAANSHTIYKLDKKIMRMYGDFYDFPERFKNLPRNMQTKGKEEAKKRLVKRLSGVGGIEVDLLTTTKNALNEKKNNTRLIKKSSKKKILIFTHDFMDAIHVFGNLIFSDFYEWLIYLGELSNKTDYDWYIKNHPKGEGRVLKAQTDTKKIVNELIIKYKKFNLIPDNISHQRIVEEGIDFILTGYGSVGIEYPLLNIPVINASANNPHIGYNFNFHPKNLEEYENLLKNLNNLNVKINKEEIYEYYFMRHIFSDFNWLINDRKEWIDYVQGYDGMFSYKMYEYWMKTYNIKKHFEIIDSIEKFIKSNENAINITHTKNYNKFI